MKLRIALAVVIASGSAASAFAGGPVIPFFFNHDQFVAFNQTHGKQLKGIETFEEAVINQGQKIAFPNSLLHGVPNGPFPNGIDEANLKLQSNVTPGPLAPFPNPSANPNALYAIGAGFLGSNSVKVGEDEFLSGVQASVDLIFTPPEHTGIGFNLSRFQGFPTGGWVIGVFDFNNVLIGQVNVPPPTANEPTKTFIGVWAPIPIGRINIWDTVLAPDAIDNVEMWTDIPAPGAVGLFGVAGLLALRRRR